MNNAHHISHDPTQLKQVQRKLEKVGFFRDVKRFGLKRSTEFNKFRGSIEHDIGRALSSKKRIQARISGGLHKIDADGIVEDIKNTIDSWFDITFLVAEEATELSQRADTDLREKIERIKSDDKAQFTGGRFPETFKMICMDNLVKRFEKYTKIKKSETFAEIAGLFLLFGLSDPVCGKVKNNIGIRSMVYTPSWVGDSWEIECRVKKYKLRQCYRFNEYEVSCEELEKGNTQGRCGCVKAILSLKASRTRWRREQKGGTKK